MLYLCIGVLPEKHNCNADKLIKLELICDGVIPARVHKEYIEYLEKNTVQRLFHLV